MTRKDFEKLAIELANHSNYNEELLTIFCEIYNNIYANFNEDKFRHLVFKITGEQ